MTSIGHTLPAMVNSVVNLEKAEKSDKYMKGAYRKAEATVKKAPKTDWKASYFMRDLSAAQTQKDTFKLRTDSGKVAKAPIHA